MIIVGAKFAVGGRLHNNRCAVEGHTIVGSRGAVWLLMLCLVASGCSDGKPHRVPVSGTIMYKGERVAWGEVVFAPVDHSKGVLARGKANERGEFMLTTFDANDGAVPGEYKVLVFAYRSGTDQKREPDRRQRAGLPAVPEKYFNKDTTDITATVENKAATIQLDLKD